MLRIYFLSFAFIMLAACSSTEKSVPHQKAQSSPKQKKQIVQETNSGNNNIKKQENIKTNTDTKADKTIEIESKSESLQEMGFPDNTSFSFNEMLEEQEEQKLQETFSSSEPIIEELGMNINEKTTPISSLVESKEAVKSEIKAEKVDENWNEFESQPEEEIWDEPKNEEIDETWNESESENEEVDETWNESESENEEIDETWNESESEEVDETWNEYESEKVDENEESWDENWNF